MKFFNFKHWEYWPSYLFYLPNIPYAAYLALKAKNLVFYSATNPAILHSGNGSESKFSSIELVPESFKPVSIFIKSKLSTDLILEKFKQSNIKYPIIVKPDIGFRGLLVKKINSNSELIAYLERYKTIDLIIQEFVDFKQECGIFYYRLPNASEGKITSITLKKYLSVTGDGISTLEMLIKKNERAKLYLPLLKQLHKKDFDLILQKNEEKILNFIGNHSKGTQFINGNYLISRELELSINTIVKQIPGFYYGRLDIKYDDFDDLISLKKLKILEINGIISEPTHIYDPTKISYFNALKEIRKHWNLMYKIATTNHKELNVKYNSIGYFLDSLKRLNKYSKTIKQLQKN
jgi:hypothetical protein